MQLHDDVLFACDLSRLSWAEGFFRSTDESRSGVENSVSGAASLQPGSRIGGGLRGFSQ